MVWSAGPTVASAEPLVTTGLLGRVPPVGAVVGDGPHDARARSA